LYLFIDSIVFIDQGGHYSSPDLKAAVLSNLRAGLQA
jgi:hypothetical protein